MRTLRHQAAHFLKLVMLLIVAGLLLLSLRGCLPSAQALPELSQTPNLNFDLARLEARVDRLEAQLALASGEFKPARPPSTLEQRPARPLSVKDLKFDRLATLVVELKERLTSVESRLSQLESRVTPNTPNNP